MEDPSSTLTEMMKTSFQHRFRTGNVIWDTIIDSLIITTWSGFFMNSLSLNRIKNGILVLLGSRKQSIEITGMITRTGEKHWPTFSTRFKAVLYQIKKLKLTDSKIVGLKEIKIDNETDFFVYQPLKFQFSPNVFGDFNGYELQKPGTNGGSPYTEEHFTIVISSWKKTLQELKDILETWEAEYRSSFVKQTITLTGTLEKDKGIYGIQSFEFSDRFLLFFTRLVVSIMEIPILTLLSSI